MDREFVEWIYDSLMGSLTEACHCNEVEDLFEEGMPCEVLYGQMLDITKIVGLKMFEYGRKFSER